MKRTRRWSSTRPTGSWRITQPSSAWGRARPAPSSRRSPRPRYSSVSQVSSPDSTSVALLVRLWGSGRLPWAVSWASPTGFKQPTTRAFTDVSTLGRAQASASRGRTESPRSTSSPSPPRTCSSGSGTGRTWRPICTAARRGSPPASAGPTTADGQPLALETTLCSWQSEVRKVL